MAQAVTRGAGPMVTCVMLTRWPDRRAMMRDALASFHAQTYSPRELLVVNEGEPLTSLVRGVRVVNTGPRSSLGEQRDVGLREADGEYVATWDDDDASMPTRLSEQVAAAEAGADYVLCHRLWLADASLNPVCEASAVAYVTALVRRDAALAAGGHGRGDYGEDAALNRAMKSRGARFAALDVPLYVYRRHGGNVSTKATGEDLDSWFRFCSSPSVDGARSALAAMRRAPRPEMLSPAGRRA